MSTQGYPLIVREHQQKLLINTFTDCLKNKKLQVQIITGEAGTGKSIICEMFKSLIETEYLEVKTAATFCTLHSEFCLPYAPFRELLKQLLLPCDEEDSPKESKKKTFNHIIRKSLECAPELIGTFIPGGSIIAKVGEELINELGLMDKFAKKPTAEEKVDMLDERKILSQYSDIIRIISDKQPIFLIFDDFQWADKASANMLYYMIRSLHDCPVYLLVSYRSTEIMLSSDGEQHVLTPILYEIKRNFGNVIIDLDIITDEEKKETLNQLIDLVKNNFDEAFRSSLFQITNGNPLFVHEILELLKENNEIIQIDNIWTVTQEISWHQKPAKIEGIIEERISKLEASSIDLLSHASVQGNHFIAQILSRTLNETEREVLSSLTRKLQKEHKLVKEINCIRSGKNIISQFQFSNFIFQHYLYEELSFSQRMLLHGEIAEMMEEIYADHLDDVAAEIAEHYELSGELFKALQFFHQAADHAFRISCFSEALKLYKKSIELIENLNDENIRNQKLDITINYSICLRNILGYDHPDVEKYYLKAMDLAKEFNESGKTSIIIFGLWSIYIMNLELLKAEDFALKFMQQGKDSNNLEMINEAIISLANTYFWQGKFNQSIALLNQFDQSVCPNSETDAFHKMLELLSMQKINHPDKNIKLQQLEDFSRTNPNPFNKAIVYQCLSWFFYFEHNYLLMEENSIKLVNITKEHNFINYLGLGYMFQGRALAQQNQTEKARNLIETGYKKYMVVNGGKIMNSVYSLVLSDVLMQQSCYEESRDVLQAGIKLAQTMGEHCYLAELLFSLNQIYKLLGDNDKAELCLQECKQTNDIQSSVLLAEQCTTTL